VRRRRDRRLGSLSALSGALSRLEQKTPHKKKLARHQAPRTQPEVIDELRPCYGWALHGVKVARTRAHRPRPKKGCSAYTKQKHAPVECRAANLTRSQFVSHNNFLIAWKTCIADSASRPCVFPIKPRAFLLALFRCSRYVMSLCLVAGCFYCRSRLFGTVLKLPHNCLFNVVI